MFSKKGRHTLDYNRNRRPCQPGETPVYRIRPWNGPYEFKPDAWEAKQFAEQDMEMAAARARQERGQR